MDVSKNRGKTPKMDGENHGKTLLKWMVWWYPYFWKHLYATENVILCNFILVVTGILGWGGRSKILSFVAVGIDLFNNVSVF